MICTCMVFVPMSSRASSDHDRQISSQNLRTRFTNNQVLLKIALNRSIFHARRLGNVEEQLEIHPRYIWACIKLSHFSSQEYVYDIRSSPQRFDHLLFFLSWSLVSSLSLTCSCSLFIPFLRLERLSLRVLIPSIYSYYTIFILQSHPTD